MAEEEGLPVLETVVKATQGRNSLSPASATVFSGDTKTLERPAAAQKKNSFAAGITIKGLSCIYKLQMIGDFCSTVYISIKICTAA